MDTVVISQIQSFVKVSWSEPESNGSSLLGYRIEIQTSDPIVYVEDLDYCNG